MASSLGSGKMITDGLVLHLDAANNKSYPGSGTVWTDLSSTAITGSLTNGPTFSSVNNGIINFDGTNDRVDISNNTNLNPVKEFTLGCWVNARSLSTTYLGIIDKYNGSLNYGYMIDIPNGGAGRPLSKFRFVNCAGATFQEVIATGSLITGSWYNVVGTYDGTNINIYVNGIFDGKSPLTGNNVIDTGSLVIGGDGVSTNYLSCSISQVSLHNRALSANEVFQNYEATRERFNRPTIVTDDDARNFLNSANISSETQQRAVNDLVVDMKNVGLWNKMKAIYPFVGGTAASHKWNLKDPRDVDAAFRLSFSGGWTHSSTGAKTNGSNGYANTYLIGSSSLSSNNTHLSYYSRTNSDGNYIDMGMYSITPSVATTVVIAIRLLGNYYYDSYSPGNSGRITGTSSTSLGYYFNSRTSSTSFKSYKDGVQLGTTVTTGGGLDVTNMNLPIYLNASNDKGTPQYYTNRECAFATIGDGLSDNDIVNMYTIVQKYQTTLGRQV